MSDTTTAEYKNVYHAFLAAQQKMTNATKSATNPHFKSRYADLNAVREAVMPALNSVGIAVIQPEIVIEGRNYVRTTLYHAASETEIHSDVEILMMNDKNPQQQGSAITYARRYGLQSICGIGAEDDDANVAAQPAAQAVPATGQSVSAGKKAFTKSMITENFLLWLNAELLRTNTSLYNVLDHHFAMFNEDKQAVGVALQQFKNRQQNG